MAYAQHAIAFLCQLDGYDAWLYIVIPNSTRPAPISMQEIFDVINLHKRLLLGAKHHRNRGTHVSKPPKPIIFGASSRLRESRKI